MTGAAVVTAGEALRVRGCSPVAAASAASAARAGGLPVGAIATDPPSSTCKGASGRRVTGAGATAVGAAGSVEVERDASSKAAVEAGAGAVNSVSLRC
jgi:hypothetical protein